MRAGNLELTFYERAKNTYAVTPCWYYGSETMDMDPMAINSGRTVSIPDEITHKLWKRTDYTWLCTWFALRVTGKGAFKTAYRRGYHHALRDVENPRMYAQRGRKGYLPSRKLERVRNGQGRAGLPCLSGVRPDV